jgi:hypothetical protein
MRLILGPVITCSFTSALYSHIISERRSLYKAEANPSFVTYVAGLRHKMRGKSPQIEARLASFSAPNNLSPIFSISDRSNNFPKSPALMSPHRDEWVFGVSLSFKILLLIGFLAF